VSPCCWPSWARSPWRSPPTSALRRSGSPRPSGPGYTISLKKGTKVVRTLKRGTYRITVRDRSDEHNFRLRGPSGRLLSSVGWAGTKTVTLRLRPGRYTYVCDPHADEMRGGFRVT
jgi:hypothetical protein